MTTRRWLAATATALMLASSCGADENTRAEPGEVTSTAEGKPANPCPDPLVIQTDWFPESEYGAIYNLVGDDYSIDAENLVVSGQLWAEGRSPTGIDIEVRTGGPAIGFSAPSVHMYTDESIHLGFADTDNQAATWDTVPLVSVMAPLDKSPQMIMWDPDEHPNIRSIADIGDAGVTVNTFAGASFADYFVASGVWSETQVDPSYDGSPARFISEPSIAQQGFASTEPYMYLNDFDAYAKPVAYQLIHDAGFPTYSQTLGVKPDDLPWLQDCLEWFVPVVQRSVVEYAASPERAIGIIVDAVETYDSFWIYHEELAEYSLATMNELDLHGNGDNTTVGDIDAARVQKIIDDGRAAGIDIPADLTADDLFTNRFLDESIGFPDGP